MRLSPYIGGTSPSGQERLDNDGGDHRGKKRLEKSHMAIHEETHHEGEQEGVQ